MQDEGGQKGVVCLEREVAEARRADWPTMQPGCEPCGLSERPQTTTPLHFHTSHLVLATTFYY